MRGKKYQGNVSALQLNLHSLSISLFFSKFSDPQGFCAVPYARRCFTSKTTPTLPHASLPTFLFSQFCYPAWYETLWSMGFPLGLCPNWVSLIFQMHMYGLVQIRREICGQTEEHTEWIYVCSAFNRYMDHDSIWINGIGVWGAFTGCSVRNLHCPAAVW